MDIKDLAKEPKNIIWETFSIFYDVDKIDYYSITRKEMISLMFSSYQSNPNKVYEILNEDELEILKDVFEGNIVKSDYCDFRFYGTYLLISDSDTTNFVIVDSLKETIKKGLTIYQANKEEISKAKIKVYLLVGLLTAYGALTKKEIKYLYNLYYNDFSDDLFNNLYFRRYAKKKKAGVFVLDYLSKEDEYKQILKTHTMPFKTLYSKESLISLGKYGYDKTLKEFDMINNKKIREFFARKRKFIYHLIGQIYPYSILSFGYVKEYFENDEQYRCFNRFISKSPKFLLSDNDNSIVSKEEKDLYLDTIPDFIEYASKKYDIIIDNGNVHQSYLEVVGRAKDEDFNIIDEYIKEKNLNDKQITLLKQFKKGQDGVFIVAKRTTNGLIMLDKEYSYLVKEFARTIMKKTYQYACMDYIFPYNGKIISCDFMLELPIKLPRLIINEVKERLAVENVYEDLKERKYFGEVELSPYFSEHYMYGIDKFTTQEELDYFVYLWDEVLNVCEEYKITSFVDLADLIGNVDIYDVLGQFCAKVDHSDASLDYSKAINDFKELLKLSIEPVLKINISNLLGVLYFKENDSDSAEQVLTNVILDYPNIVEPYFNLVQGNLIYGNKEKALYYFDLLKKNKKIKNNKEVKKLEKKLTEI